MAMDVEIKRQGTSVLSYFHRSNAKRITMAETECESVEELQEALNSCLGLVCSLLTSTGECLIKKPDATKQYKA